MALTPGTKLGPYEVGAPAGSGGMGEVYRGRDTRLDRSVAIKVLPAGQNATPDARQRFEREARAISAISHPNICQLYDIGSHEGYDYLVLELLDGETLDKRLERGKLPVEQAIKIAIEIAEGLQRAHSAGLVHRDLKPGNIMLTKSGAKLLDFGLAKSSGLAAAASGNVPLFSATATIEGPSSGSPLTSAGMIVGTIQYMAPEQVAGGRVDSRADLFAFGSVLYEMVTGKRAFEGKSQLSVASAILEREPEPISVVEPTSPPELQNIISSCLMKDPDDRIQTAHDIKLQLQWTQRASSGAIRRPDVALRHSKWKYMAIGALGVAALAVALASWAMLRPRTQPGGHYSILAPERFSLDILLQPLLDVSPDGSMIAFIASNEIGTQLFVRPINSYTAQALPGSHNARNPVFSPDGRWIAFHQNGQIRKAAPNGGAPQVIRQAQSTQDLDPRGIAWLNEKELVFSPVATGPIKILNMETGAERELSKLDPAKHERSHRWPTVLPGGKWVLFTVGFTTSPDNYEDSPIDAVNVKDGTRRRILSGASMARYSKSGHLLFAHGGQIFMQEFDPETLQLHGLVEAVASGVVRDAGTGGAHFSISASGALAYVPGDDTGLLRMAWMNDNGNEEALPVEEGAYIDPRLSPDGKKVAIKVQKSGADIWIYDLTRRSMSRFTFSGDAWTPIWTPDGRNIYFSSLDSTGTWTIMRKPVAGGEVEKIATSSQRLLLETISPDGRSLYGTMWNESLSRMGDIMRIPLDGSGKVETFVGTASDEFNPDVSPDGRMITYVSTETGQPEIYVRSLLGEGRWQVSSNGGEEPRWAKDGKKIYFRHGIQMFVSNVSTDSGFESSQPKVWSNAIYNLRSDSGVSYSVANDGRLLLLRRTGANTAPTVIQFIPNWADEIKKSR